MSHMQFVHRGLVLNLDIDKRGLLLESGERVRGSALQDCCKRQIGMVDSFDVVVDGDLDARVRLLDRVWLRVLVVAKVRLSGLGRADVHLCCEWADNLQCGKHVECADVRATLSSEIGYGTVGQGIIKAAGKTRPIRATRENGSKRQI
jgi:hypothetical protein